MRDVGQPIARHHRRDSGLQRFPGRRAERFVGRIQCVDPEGDRGVTMPPVQHRAAVNGHQVAGSKNFRGGGDAVHHPVVHRGADRRRIPVVAQEGRHGTAGSQPLIDVRGDEIDQRDVVVKGLSPLVPRLDVVAESGIIERGSPVRVVAVEGTQIIVRKV